MKKLGKIRAAAFAGLSALAIAAPVAIAQTSGGDQGAQKGAHERHGSDGFGERGGRRGGGDHFGGRMFRGVELTDAQKASLKQLREGFGERTKSLREQLRAKHEELRQAESNGTFSESLAAQKLAELAPIQAKLMAEEFKLRQDSLAVLTPEQRAQLEQRRAEFKAKREQFKARRGGNQTEQQ